MLVDFSAPKAERCIRKRCGGSRTLLCGTCRERLAAELKDLPRTHDNLVQAMIPMSRPPFPRVKGTRSTSGITIDEDASSGRSEILGFLRSWSALVADERSLRKPASQECHALTSFLLTHLDWLLAHPTAADFDEETHTLAARLRRITDSVLTQFDIGPCVQPGCGGRLFALQSGNTGKYEVQCGEGHAWQANQWLHLYWKLQATR
jgi:hypothetical protein